MQLSHGRFMSCLMSFQSCLVGIHCCLVCIYCCLMCLVRTRITYGSWRGTAWTDLFSKGRYRAPFEHKTTHILEWWRTSLKQTLTKLSNPWSPGPEVLMKCECELWWQTSWSYLSHPRLALDSMIQLWHAMTTWTTISLQALPLFLKPDLHRQLSGGLAWTWANAKQMYDWLRIAKIYLSLMRKIQAASSTDCCVAIRSLPSSEAVSTEKLFPVRSILDRIASACFFHCSFDPLLEDLAKCWIKSKYSADEFPKTSLKTSAAFSMSKSLCSQCVSRACSWPTGYGTDGWNSETCFERNWWTLKEMPYFTQGMLGSHNGLAGFHGMPWTSHQNHQPALALESFRGSSKAFRRIGSDKTSYAHEISINLCSASYEGQRLSHHVAHVTMRGSRAENT